MDTRRPPGPRRRRFPATARLREARQQALVVCLVLATGALFLLSTPGRLDRFGQLKGRDFVFFFGLGRIALDGNAGTALYDMEAEHRVRAALVPESAGQGFASAYPPQTALIFAPFAMGSYGAGAIMWALSTLAVYLLVPWLCGGSRWWPLAFAFPPFWFLLLGGQSTTIPLLGFLLGWYAWERRSPVLAGLAFGLIAIKPQLGIPLTVALLVGREWRVIAGALLSIGAQIVLTLVLLGSGPFRHYLEVLRHPEETRRLLQPHVAQVQSFQALCDLLPEPWNLLAWIVIAAIVVGFTAAYWRSAASLRMRLGAVVIATVLASPHLLVYDATLLVLPLFWIGSELHPRQLPIGALYALYLSLLVPVALIVHVQISVIVLAYLWAAVISIRGDGRVQEAVYNPRHHLT